MISEIEKTETVQELDPVKFNFIGQKQPTVEEAVLNKIRLLKAELQQMQLKDEHLRAAIKKNRYLIKQHESYIFMLSELPAKINDKEAVKNENHSSINQKV